jgi:phosphoserine phosphatase
MQRKIRPIIRERAVELLASHADALRAIVTATNRFITRPIADELGIEHLDRHRHRGSERRFTGKPRGHAVLPRGQDRARDEWLAARGRSLGDFESWFYSDSLNDMPLLEHVDHPVAVDPDPPPRARDERGWPSSA